MTYDKEIVEYFENSKEKNMDSKIIELKQRIDDLGKKRRAIEKSKAIDKNDKKIQLETIDNEASYYLNEINKITRKLYRGVR